MQWVGLGFLFILTIIVIDVKYVQIFIVINSFVLFHYVIYIYTLLKAIYHIIMDQFKFQNEI